MPEGNDLNRLTAHLKIEVVVYAPKMNSTNIWASGIAEEHHSIRMRAQRCKRPLNRILNGIRRR
jgi:ribosomal protein L31E